MTGPTAPAARHGTGWLPRVQYLPRGSPLHSLDPVGKLACLVGGAVTAFILWETWQLLVMLGAVVAGFPVARLRWWEFRAGARFFLWFSAALMAIHALFVHQGATAWEARAGPLHVLVTWGGLQLGLDMVARFLVVVLGSFLFVATTEPNALAHALMRSGVPYRAGFALVLALRLMPLLRSESNAVREAQSARGLAIDRSGPRAALGAVRATFLPLLVSSLSRVDSLVVSMEGRAFGRHPTRTFVRQVRWRSRDTAVLCVAVALPLVSAWVRWWPM
jgi:energy-coupling factor transport system permease protein